MLLGNALDPGGGANHPQPASARPHRNQMGTVLGKDKPVWCSRYSPYNGTLITGRTQWRSQRAASVRAAEAAERLVGRRRMQSFQLPVETAQGNARRQSHRSTASAR